MPTNEPTKPLITDEQRLVSAHYEPSGYEIPTYDDGYGTLYIMRDSISTLGIVRAQTWIDAYNICEDEFFPEATETLEDFRKEYGFKREHKKVTADNGTFVKWETIETPDPDSWPDNELFQEAFGFRPNGSNVRDKIGHGIYQKDLNGESLDILTAELARDMGIVLVIEDEDEDTDTEPATTN